VISIYEIKGWSDVAAFMVWTLAVCAIAKALFGSFLAAELQYRLSLRDAPRRQRMNRLNWEVNNRAKWDEDAARRTPHSARQPLSDLDIDVRRAELQRLARASIARRACTYFMACFACQTFWTALTVFAATHVTFDVLSSICSAAAYSAAAVALAAVTHQRPLFRAGTSEQQPACKNCGK